MPRHLASAAPALLLIPFLLLGCSVEPAPSETETFQPGPGVPLDPNEPTAVPVEADTTLMVQVTALFADGSSVDLALGLHGATRWDDVATQAIPQVVSEQCPELSAQRFEAEAWSFTRANVSALSTDAAVWPAIGVLPSDAGIALVVRGDVGATSGAAACQGAGSVQSTGNGALAIGIAGDADSLQAWAGHRFGFTAPAGVTFTSCEFELTDLGRQLGGGIGWAEINTPTECSTGP